METDRITLPHPNRTHSQNLLSNFEIFNVLFVWTARHCAVRSTQSNGERSRVRRSALSTLEIY